MKKGKSTCEDRASIKISKTYNYEIAIAVTGLFINHAWKTQNL